MGTGFAIPLHLAVHVLGLAVAAGLAVLVLVERRTDLGGRVGIVFGATLLAVSHLGVGALVAEPDGPVLLLRAAGYAALAVGAAGRLVGGAAVIAILPPFAHVMAALAGLAASVATARGVLGRGWSIAPLAVGVALWAVADLVVGTRVEVAGVLSLAGSLAAGSWLLRRAADRSLAGRLAAVFLLVLLLLTVGLASASGLVFSADLRAEQTDRLGAVAAAQATQLATGWPREQESTASLLAGSTLVAEIDQVAAGDRADLHGRARAIVELPGVDLAVLTNQAGVVIGASLRGERPPATDLAVLAGDPVVRGAVGGAITRGLVNLGGGRVVAVGATPVAPREADGTLARDRQVGVLLTGRFLTDAPVLESIAGDVAADVAVIVDGRVAGSTLPRSLDRHVMAAPPSGEVVIDGQRRLAASVPLADRGEPAVGRLVLLLPAGAFASAADTALRSVFLVAAAALLAAGVLAVAASRWVTRPVGQLTAAAERVAQGDLTTRVEVARRDEVGRLGAAFDRMTISLAAREEELRAAAATEASLRARLEAVTASMGEALLATDRQGRLVTANPAAGDLLGVPHASLPGRPVAEVLVGEAEGGRDLLQALGDAGALQTAVSRGRLQGGSRMVTAVATPLVDAGRVVGRVYVVRDITSEVQAERLKTEIIANVSHELRTPLTPIRGYLDLLRHRQLTPAQVKDFATQAAESANRLQRTVDALIDLADLEAGRVEVTPEAVPVGAIIDTVLERWREHAPDRRLTRRVQRGLPPVEVDTRLLARALDALVENALKFSDGPVRLLAAAEDDGRVRLTVRDQGPGIPPDRLARVLDDFEQADGSATRHVGGLGLGLAIVKRVLARSNAEFSLTSTPGQGTDATLLLPTADR